MEIPLSYPLLRYTNANFIMFAEDIDSSYAINDLEKHAGPSKWLNKKKCLEAVYRSLLRYIRNHTLDLDYLTLETTIDFDAIAEHDDIQETIKVPTHVPAEFSVPQLESDLTNTCIQLLTIFLMAAVNGPTKQKYIGQILNQLDESAQVQIMDLIKEVGCIYLVSVLANQSIVGKTRGRISSPNSWRRNPTPEANKGSPTRIRRRACCFAP